MNRIIPLHETYHDCSAYVNKKHAMAFSWNPFSQFDFDGEHVVIRLPYSGYFARVTGPIVELLSQLPFSDVEEAVQVWQDRTGAREETLRIASDVWQQLCEGEIVLDLPEEEIQESQPAQWITLSRRDSHSRFTRFMDFQDFPFEEDAQNGHTETQGDEIWPLGA
tara:strand:- start:1145 stop:1639 length:495 start_codon:yes stop_codon:yes gene_type:complete